MLRLCCLELVNHPEVQRKLQKEIDDVIGERVCKCFMYGKCSCTERSQTDPVDKVAWLKKVAWLPSHSNPSEIEPAQKLFFFLNLEMVS